MILHHEPHQRLRSLLTLAASTLAATFLLIALAPALIAQTSAPSLETLRKDFQNPPNAARPMVRLSSASTDRLWGLDGSRSGFTTKWLNWLPSYPCSCCELYWLPTAFSLTIGGQADSLGCGFMLRVPACRNRGKPDFSAWLWAAGDVGGRLIEGSEGAWRKGGCGGDYSM